jgi:hypothetical protein
MWGSDGCFAWRQLADACVGTFRSGMWGRVQNISSETNSTFTRDIMLYLIGLGLSDETDITVKGLSVVRKASRVYLEAYTSILLVEKSILVCFPFLFGRKSS